MIIVALGTRPEVIKLGPVIREMSQRGIDYELVHTGQHFDDQLSADLLETFSLGVHHQYRFGGLSRGVQIGEMVTVLSRLFERRPPTAVIVQGDTNSVLAAGLAANATETPLVHVEAGLRSFDRAMPEEHNRVVVDHLADLLCAPTDNSRLLLESERVQGEVLVTGNTEMDAVRMLTPSRSDAEATARSYGFEPGRFVLATIHRPENTDSAPSLARVVDALVGCGAPVLLAAHPRTDQALRRHGLASKLERADNVSVTPPLDPITLWGLLKVCLLAVSDSGGLQEDVTMFATPMVVVRNSTERPEALDTFARLCRPQEDLAARIRLAVDEAPIWRESLQGLTSPYLGPGGRSPSAVIVDAVEAIEPAPSSRAAAMAVSL